jgi:hypothetical protein
MSRVGVVLTAHPPIFSRVSAFSRDFDSLESTPGAFSPDVLGREHKYDEGQVSQDLFAEGDSWRAPKTPLRSINLNNSR